MAVFPRSDVTDDDVKQRAQQIAERQARAELEAERARAEQARAAAEAQIAAQRRARDEKTVQMLRELRGLQEELDAEEQIIADAIVRRQSLHDALQSGLNAAHGSAYWGGVDDFAHNQKWGAMQRSAGLHITFDDTYVRVPSGAAGKLALTVLRGMRRSVILPGGLLTPYGNVEL